MKKIFIFVLVSFPFLVTQAQDSTWTLPKLLIRPFVEQGIDFIRNNELKDLYNTQSAFNYGFGFQFGHPVLFKVIPYIQYNYSKFTVTQKITDEVKADNSLSIKQYSGGLIIPLKKINKTIIRAKVGCNYVFINEAFQSINDQKLGFQLGLGIEHKTFKCSRVYLDASYHYQKSGEAELRDFDRIKVAMGFIL